MHSSSEQRSAFRIQMPDGQKHASLRVEGRSVDVHLVDASATGVAVACPLSVTLDIDDRAELHTAAGGGLIRIVRKEIFSDGVLLGAERIGDLSEAEGFLAQLGELAMWPLRTFQTGHVVAKIGVVSAVVAIGGVAAAFCFGWEWMAKTSRPITVEVPVATTQPATAEIQNVLKQVEVLLPATPPVSESDQRARRILEQQKQLLTPETIRRLRLTPSQESQIQRSLDAAKAAADAPSQDSWEAIRRSETQILKVLTPTQIKIWRQQSGT
ncbi:hypothetical protein [Anatilimnocola floriformis]|uniref:hypothetical protein n=1 Tax=Anatilimnocola floriformis TaxID=2948575 RepID=UPI0020C4FACA|nr:hypothetical protein [Anatilimnocola floriformis]